MQKKEKIRLNLEFPKKVTDRLDKLVELSDSSTRTEVIKKSLSLFDIILTHIEEKKGKVIMVDENGQQETLRIV